MIEKRGLEYSLGVGLMTVILAFGFGRSKSREIVPYGTVQKIEHKNYDGKGCAIEYIDRGNHLIDLGNEGILDILKCSVIKKDGKISNDVYTREMDERFIDVNQTLLNWARDNYARKEKAREREMKRKLELEAEAKVLK